MRLVVFLSVVVVLCAPASIAAAAPPATTTTPLSPTVAWPLTPARGAPVVAHSTISLPEDLPYTGDNLAPEAIGAVLLIAVGVGIRLRLRWR